MSLNRYLFTETGTDSGAINVLGTVVTQFEDTGTYRVELFDGEQYLTHRTLVVSQDEPAMQVSIDFASLPERRQNQGHKPKCICNDHETLRLRENGYLLLHVSQGPGAYAAIIHEADADRDRPEFDSRELDEGAYFSVLLIRPGKYVARNELGEGEFEFAIPRPDVEEGLEVPEEPLRVSVTERGIQAKEAELLPTQGLVFEIETEARIVVEQLGEDGDEGKRPPGKYIARTPRQIRTVSNRKFDKRDRGGKSQRK